MQILDLTGTWNVTRIGDDAFAPLDAVVPGGVHAALIAAGAIPDPGIDNNAEKIAWVGDADWAFERPFHVDAAMLAHDCVELEFDGIDTLADVFVNGVCVIRADNMFKRWAADVREILVAGDNTVRVEIHAPRGRGVAGRKAKYGFGSAYSPRCVTAGICRPVRITAWDTARIRNVGFSQLHEETGEPVEVFIGGWVDGFDGELDGLRVSFAVTDHEGREVARVDGDLPPGGDGAFNGAALIEEPHLWWPNGMGAQPLYTVETFLRTADGALLDHDSRRIGLRTLCAEAQGDAGTGNAGIVRMFCNGECVLLRGGVWIPPGLFPSHTTDEDYLFLVGSAAEAGLNAFRIWDGGTFEDDLFWELCDERGIIVTGVSDMCAAIDSDDDESGDDNDMSVFRLFRHACLPDGLLCEVAEENGLVIMRDTLAYPAPDTMEAHVAESDRNLTSAAMEARIAGAEAAHIVARVAESWPLPMSFRAWMWQSQIAQAHELRRRVEALRCNPHTASGILWEPYASCWAIADGASIDSEGVWKAAHYAAQACCQPIIIAGEAPTTADSATGAVSVKICNDTPVRRELAYTWRATSLDGSVLDEGGAVVAIAPRGVTLASELNLAPFLAQYTARNLILWLTLFDEEGFVLSRNHVLFGAPKHLALDDPGISVDIDDTMEFDGEDVFKVTLSATSTALRVWLDLDGEDAQFSDNFVDLEPDEPLDLYVSPVRRMTQFTFRKKLRVHSLYDIARGSV